MEQPRIVKCTNMEMTRKTRKFITSIIRHTTCQLMLTTCQFIVLTRSVRISRKMVEQLTTIQDCFKRKSTATRDR